MEIILQRTTPQAESIERGRTFGRLTVEGMCLTLEDATREVQGEPVTLWKIPKQSAIPAGRCRVTLEDSPKFGPNTITLTGIDPTTGELFKVAGTLLGFTSVRMHNGVTADHTEGCPLIGFGASGDSLTNSKAALEALKPAIKAAIARGEEVWLEIRPEGYRERPTIGEAIAVLIEAVVGLFTRKG